MKWTEAFDSMEDYTQLLNFRLEWRKWTPESHFKGQKILDQLVMNMNKGQSLPYALQAWQLWQKILMGISNDPEADKKSLQKILDKGFEIQETEDMYAVRALVGTRTLSLPCESAKSDLDKAIGLGGGSDTLTIAAGVYSSCDDQKQAIGVSKRALALTPNDADWFITLNLT